MPATPGWAHDGGMQHALAYQIGDVPTFAFEKALVLDPLHGLADPGLRSGARDGHGRRFTTMSSKSFAHFSPWSSAGPGSMTWSLASLSGEVTAVLAGT